MVDQKKEHQKSLAQLVYDLKTKKILCRVRDYPAITLDELNQYVEKQGFFTPYRMVVYGNAKVAAKITSLLDGWSRWSGHGGRVTTSQGAFILEQGTDERKVRMPDVAYTPRDVDRALTNEQNRTCRGDPYVPTFVVEIDKLADRNSQRKALDRKMRDEYIPHGVQLGWLIDPRPQHRIIYEYKLDEHGQVHCVHNHKWRDLDGGNVLPDSGSSSEEEVDLPCPIPRCRTRLRTLGSLTAHVEDHRTERAIAKYVANES
ncbi:putative restriction endonuclease type II, Zinc finger C2H2-type [Plasmopara halstedii]